MAINFPSPANPGDIYTYNGYIWEYVSGGYWKSVAESDYIYSASTSGTGTSVIANITGGNLYLKSFSGNNITISESNGVLTFSAGSSSISGAYLPLSGGTVTGATNYTAGLSANTISATTYQNLPVSGLTEGSGIGITNNNNNFTISYTGSTGGGISGSGTTNYLPKWTGSTGIGNSQIRDDGTYLGIGITPSSPNKLWVYSNSLSYGIRGDGTVAGVYGQAVSSGYGVYGGANSSVGVAGVSVGDVGTNVGVYGVGDINDSGSPTNIGGHFLAQNGGSNYSVHLQDGTEGVNKVLISTTSDGKANWSNVLTGLTNVRSTTISATTYQNLPVSGLTEGSGIGITNNNNNFTISYTGSTGGLTFQQVQMVAFLSS